MNVRFLIKKVQILFIINILNFGIACLIIKNHHY